MARDSHVFSHLVTLCALFVMAAGAACSRSAPPPSGTRDAQGQGPRGSSGGAAAMPVRVQTTAVQPITVQRKVDVVGTLISLDQARVSSEVAGVVRQVLVQMGHDVKVGQPLVHLESSELSIALERAESALRQTEAQLGIQSPGGNPPPDDQVAAVRTALANRDDARAQLARVERLVGQGVLPRVELENVETRLKVAEAAHQTSLDNVRSLKASLQDRRAALELAKKKLGDATIRSPIAGSVAEQLVQVGEFTRENTPLLTIIQMNPLKLRTSVQERHTDWVRPGMPVEFRVESNPDRTFTGKVAYVSPAVDQTTRSLAIEVMVDNSHRLLKPGFFAKGSITLKEDTNVPALPENAVFTLAGVSNVFVVDDNKVRMQNVTLGVHQDGMVEILQGLQGSEILAASNLSQLSNGAQVVTAAGPGTAEEPGAGSVPASGDGGRPGEGQEGTDRRGGRDSRPSGEREEQP